MAVAPSALALFGLPADATVDDIGYVLAEATETLSRIDSKRAVLQDRIAAASRGCRRRASSRRPGAAPVPGGGDDDDRGGTYTRKGAGAVRRRLRDAAAGAKKERERLENVCGGLEEALVDAEEWLALRRGGTA